MRRVLVVEADDTARTELLLGLREREIEADAVADAAIAAVVLGQMEPSAIVLGPSSTGELGPVLRAVRAAALASAPDGAVARFTGVAAVVAVVDAARSGWEAMRLGAADFVVGPRSGDALALCLQKVDARRVFARTHDANGDAGGGPGAGDERALPPGRDGHPSDPVEPLTDFIGASANIVALLAKVRRFAPVPSAVLIGGESGTGKELIARALHALSPWRRGPFVPLNCGAIPGGLIESELFGHERGAFTDAVRDKRGLFEVADGGTLFLDEIADLPLPLQTRLLRVLQDGVVRRVGATDEMRVHVRIVAATARDLADEVRAGRFREDFYYRLAGLEITLPPLRARREDIPRLAAHFLKQACARLGLSVRDIDAEAMRLLMAYPWPGNVRELENTVERAAVLCGEDRVDAASLPDKIVAAGGSAPAPAPASVLDLTAGVAAGGDSEGPELSIKRASREIEQNFIRRALLKTHGNRVRAAELLEISHRALLYKIKDYAIDVDSGKRGDATRPKPTKSADAPGARRNRSSG
jgi:two-component system response regulator AtoC